MKTINFLIHSLPGVGKTTFGALTPDVAVADCENSSAHMSGLNRIEVRTFDDIRALLPRAQKGEFRTLFIDTLDELVDNQMKNDVKTRGYSMKNGRLTLEGYGILKDSLIAMMRGFRDANVNVLVACHTKNEDVPGEGKMWRLKLPSDWSKDIMSMQDAAGFLALVKDNDGNEVRRLFLRPSERYEAKARGDIDLSTRKVVDILPPHLDNATFGDILSIYEKHYSPKPETGKK
jgi:hypothetical protein